MKNGHTQVSNSFLKLTVFVSALVLCLWTTTFTLIASFTPSSAAGKRYYQEVNDSTSFATAAKEIAALTANTTRANSAVIKLTGDFEITDEQILFRPDAITDNLSENRKNALMANPKALAYVTLDLNGHVLRLRDAAIQPIGFIDLEIIDSNPAVQNTLPNEEKIIGGAIYGRSGAETSSIQAYYGFITINGGNFYGNLGFLVTLGDLTINQGVIKCHFEQIDEIEVVSSSVMVLVVTNMAKSNVYINGGTIDHRVTVVRQTADGNSIITNPTIIAQYVTVDESKVNVKKDNTGNIIGYEEKLTPVDPDDPDEQDPVENPDDQPDDNNTPVISGTTNNGQPTSEDFMKIMMIGVLVIVALSVVSVSVSLLVVTKRRLQMA